MKEPGQFDSQPAVVKSAFDLREWSDNPMDVIFLTLLGVSAYTHAVGSLQDLQV